MCRSVPQMDAILTLTRTSVRPNCGLGTSQISVPGAGAGFTTASMVSGMRMAPARVSFPSFRQRRAKGRGARGTSAQYERSNGGQTDKFSTRGGYRNRGRQSLLRLLFLQQVRVVGLALALGNAQRFPLHARQVFRQENDLPNVIGVMNHLAVDGLQYRMWFAANRNRALQVVSTKRIEHLKDQLPILLPGNEHLLTLGIVVHDEFAVTVAVWFLAIGGKKVGEA